MPTPPVPQHCPSARELDDLELLVSGALAPLTGFDEPGSPVTLSLPEDVATAARAAGAVELVDPEGLPLARVQVPGGAVEPLTHAQFGPFRDHYLTPAESRERYAGRTVVPVVDALTTGQLAQLADEGPLLLLALAGTGTPELSPVALVRATLRAAELLPDAVVVAVPLASHGDAETDHALGLGVVGTYAGPDRVLGLPEADEDDELPAPVAAVVAHDRPAPGEQGLVLFFTGLSGSGKSTLARALLDRILERGERTVTSLDGDVVRRHLSAGLGFSAADRETNIRRIGWVAAEIARHGGVALCSPIAPFDRTRQEVRRMVGDAGGAFFLVHVATPLAECERRDRKGLYARARRGEIGEFTGISSPYEAPEDADVVVDTTGRSIEDALDDVLVALAATGHLDLRRQPARPVVEPGGARGAPAGGRVADARDERRRIETPAPDRPEHPLRVLFVCTANICRSPFMELMARRIAGPDASVVFASAGTHGFRAHRMDEVMAATATARGVTDLDDFRSRPLTREILEDADLVLTAEAAHRTFILDDHPGLFRKVYTLGQFAQALDGVDGAPTGRDLLAAVAGRRGAADVALDVRDPYRLGPAAAEEAAVGIEALLRRVVPALTGSAEGAARR